MLLLQLYFLTNNTKYISIYYRLKNYIKFGDNLQSLQVCKVKYPYSSLILIAIRTQCAIWRFILR